MSDIPTPPEDAPRRASGDTPTPDVASSTPRRKRPWTILGRLAKAVREQNWFAVVLELAIVVLGVVIGFQVTGWGQARADRVQERAYLHQLVEDLQRTERSFETHGPKWSQLDRSSTMLVRGFRDPRKPPTDSVLVWARDVMGAMNIPTIVTGTATALVQTGDINLIRNDSLRSSITSYIDIVERQLRYMERNFVSVRGHLATLGERVDMEEGWLVDMTPGRRDSLASMVPMFPIPAGAQRPFAPLDAEAFFQDRAAYATVLGVWQGRNFLMQNRAGALRATVALRETIEAEIDR